MNMEPENSPKAPRRTLVERWEALPARAHVAIMYPASVVILFLIHIAFFHRITMLRSLMYAVFEAPFITALVVVATASEKARRRAGDTTDSDSSQ